MTIYQPPSKPARAERCETCRFYLAGECRRYPPMVPDRLSWSAWPEVPPNSRCGEFAPKKQGA